MITIEMMYQGLLGFVTTAIWYYIKVLNDKFKDIQRLNASRDEKLQKDFLSLNEKLHHVELNYINKVDAHRESELISKLLNEIKEDLKAVANKLDMKADKQ